MIENQMENIKFVVDNSHYVSINREKLKEFENKISNLKYKHWTKDVKLKLNEKEWILLCFIIESMNFCFWQKPKWIIEYNQNKISGSNALFYSIIKSIENGGLKLSIKELKRINKSKFSSFFESVSGNISLLDQRYKNFKEVITVFDKDKDIYNKLYLINNDIELLNFIVDNFNSFNDSSTYKGKTINFNKRAILLVNDLFNVSSTINNNIKNVNNLNGCADYGVPRVFRDFGVLEYSMELRKMIDNEEEIPHNSEMEIEIRANMLYSIELIKNDLVKNGIKINSVQLDNLIWGLYKNNIGEKSKVHHTTTMYY